MNNVTKNVFTYISWHRFVSLDTFHKQNSRVRDKAICKDFGRKFSNLVTAFLPQMFPPLVRPPAKAEPPPWCPILLTQPCSSGCLWPANKGPVVPVVGPVPLITICHQWQPSPTAPMLGLCEADHALPRLQRCEE